jgi:hypothetical protein
MIKIQLSDKHHAKLYQEYTTSLISMSYTKFLQTYKFIKVLKYERVDDWIAGVEHFYYFDNEQDISWLRLHIT